MGPLGSGRKDQAWLLPVTKPALWCAHHSGVGSSENFLLQRTVFLFSAIYLSSAHESLTCEAPAAETGPSAAGSVAAGLRLGSVGGVAIFAVSTPVA